MFLPSRYCHVLLFDEEVKIKSKIHTRTHASIMYARTPTPCTPLTTHVLFICKQIGDRHK